MKITKIEHQTNQFLNDVVIQEIEKALFHAFGDKEVIAHTAAGPMNREDFIQQMKDYQEFFEKDYKRRQKEYARMNDHYNAIAYAIQYEKGLNK